MANGLAVMSDVETKTQWDHITGEAFMGPLKGKTLPVWPVRITTAAAARAEHPEARLHSSTYRSPKMWVMKLITRNVIGGRGRLPKFFHSTMNTQVDQRLPRLEQGLGVITHAEQKFFPMNALRSAPLVDTIDGREIAVECGATDGVPRAVYVDDGEEPMQLLSRWYGFSFTYPNCKVYSG